MNNKYVRMWRKGESIKFLMVACEECNYIVSYVFIDDEQITVHEQPFTPTFLEDFARLDYALSIFGGYALIYSQDSECDFGLGATGYDVLKNGMGDVNG